MVLVACSGYILTQMINYQRAQEYRESLTDGMAYIISEGIARQPNRQQKEDWISDASSLLGIPIFYVGADQVALSRAELRRIEQQKAVVRYEAENGVAYVVMGIKNDPQHYLYAQIEEITEQQMKFLPVFIQDYLAYYSGQEAKYLANIQQHFSYPVTIQSIRDLDLDSEQLSRLRLGNGIILYRDNASIRGTTISIISPLERDPSQAIVIGAVPLFNWLLGE